jgi:chemotaxis protein methyltransferase CheR
MISFGAEQDDRMTDAEFRMFSTLLRSHCGLHFGPESRFLLEKRVARRMRALELASFAAYHYQLRSCGPTAGELPLLIDELTTNETYFFREHAQLRALIGEIVPETSAERRRRGAGPVSIWCAGCSSGEEPYSIIIMALEAGLVPGIDLRVYGSDISRRMLRKARQGIYREASFRETDPHLREKYFAEKDGLWKISDRVKNQVELIHLNLLDRSKIALLGPMDVILCRNVIIYFDTEAKRQLIQVFWEKLRSGGHLLLGHSESLINLSSSFELRHLRSELVYRRPGGMPPAADSWHEAAERALSSQDNVGGEK